MQIVPQSAKKKQAVNVFKRKFWP